ncbi:MAG: substrate-binding domain-containing protein [Campylobacterota bacterium]|nr:substrate-binding domain-containing protein [Campylobacterota bacterium]
MKLILLLLSILNIVIAKDYTIGFSQDTLANDWRAAQVQEVKNEVMKYDNLNLIVKDAKAKVSQQIRDIEEFINANVDFIIASPKDAKITSLVLKKAIKKGIKVILISRTITTDDYTTFIAPNNYNIGQDAAKVLIENMNYKGTILMLQGVKGASSTQQRGDGFISIIKKYPNIQLITKRANYLRNDAIKVMEDIYKKNIKFDAIYSHSDSMLIGAREVMKRLNKDIKSIPSVSIDYIKETRKAILDGDQLGSFIYPTSGKEGIQAIVDIIDGKKVEKNVILDTILITKDNAKTITPIF